MLMCLIAAWASWQRGKRYVHGDIVTPEKTGLFVTTNGNGAAPTGSPEPDGSWVPEPRALQIAPNRGDDP
jgi:hypothetical protein